MRLLIIAIATLGLAGCSKGDPDDLCEFLIRPYLHDPESMKVLEVNTYEENIEQATKYTTHIRYTATNLMGARVQDRDVCEFTVADREPVYFDDIEFEKLTIGGESISADDLLLFEIKASDFFRGK